MFESIPTRQKNQQYIVSDKGCQEAISEMQKIEAFLEELDELSWNRYFVLHNCRIISPQNILCSCRLTIGSIISCCETCCIADANTLLRKYRDDLFFYLYIVVYSESEKIDGCAEITNKINTNIEQWTKDKLNDLHIGTVLKDIASFRPVKDAERKYKLKPYFDSLGDKLNNYVHSNGKSFYNCQISGYILPKIRKQIEEVSDDMRFITVSFLFLLTLCSPLFIMSSDYVDYLECDLAPQKDSEYWVAPFVVDFFYHNVNLIDESCINYLKENTLIIFE